MRISRITAGSEVRPGLIQTVAPAAPFQVPEECVKESRLRLLGTLPDFISPFKSEISNLQFPSRPQSDSIYSHLRRDD
jgi:hypothetical protein